MPPKNDSPNSMPLVLALDIGTSSTRALLFDARGRALPDSEAQLPFEMTTTPDGGAFVDAGQLFDLVVTSIEQCLVAAGDLADDIGAVGISSFWHSLMGVDAAGASTTPVLLWADTRSARDVDELRADHDQRDVHRRTGCVIHSSYWPAKLRWLARADRDAFARTTRWCSFADFLLRRLTGLDATSISMASGTGLLDVRSGEWEADAVAMARIDPATLPRIADERESAELSPEFARRWPQLAGKPWFPGLGDGACANAGTGAVDASRIALSLGTSGAMRVVVDRPIGSELDFPDELWAYRLDHQRVVIGAAISNGGKVLAWLSELLSVEFDGEEMIAAGAIEPDSHGLTILPFLAGERSPIWNDRATAVVAGLTLTTGGAALIRAGMEAVSLRLARLYAGLTGVAAETHEIVANGAALLNSPDWLKVTADALDHAVIALPPGEESSARGAAVMALLGIGAIESLRDVDDPAAGADAVAPSEPGVSAYRAARSRQRALEDLLFPNGSSWELKARV